jgi:glycosyltransferase involved in cell wall biosynthesis
MSVGAEPSGAATPPSAAKKNPRRNNAPESDKKLAAPLGAKSVAAKAHAANGVRRSPSAKLGAEAAAKDAVAAKPAASRAAAAPAAEAVATASDFGELADFIAGVPPAKLPAGAQVCIVTNELVAFHKNGGLGTATTGLAETLSARGVNLCIIYTAKLDLKADYVRTAIAAIKARGIEFVCLQEIVPDEWMSLPRRISYGCFWVLRDRRPAIVHFNDYLGNGYYTAQARYTGAALQNTIVIATVHGPTRWAHSIDERPVATPEQQEICFLEEKTLEFCDAVLGVSHHLLDWLKHEGVVLPRHSYVHKNIMPALADVALRRRLRAGQLTEVVFFARQDVRKGFLIMLQAIRSLSAHLPQLKFTFLGKYSNIAGEHSGAVALDELRHVPNMIDFRHDLDRDAALRYLRRQGVLAVIPSMDENSPCTVFECIVEGIPFIASVVGGIPELVAAGNRASVLFQPTAAALAAKILEVAEIGVQQATLAFDPPTIADQMVDGFSALYAEITKEHAQVQAEAARNTPLVSVVITHFNRHHLLTPLLDALEAQTYTNFEVVLVDDGSTKADSIAFLESLAKRKFRFALTVLRTPNRYLGAARNAGVQRARGEFVKFQDDDNLPMNFEIESLVRAALVTNADIVTCMSRFFVEDYETNREAALADFEYFPLGASLPLALTHNEYGDANALVRRESFLADGGFTEIYGVGSEDYEYFVKSESLGRKIVFVPEPLFHYRVSGGSMLQSTSAYRGAKRARSGLVARDSRWLKDLIDFNHEAALAREIRHMSWWRAGRREHPDLHRQMMEGDPESPQNIRRFLDLAARHGRLEDVMHMVLARQPGSDAQSIEDHARFLAQLHPSASELLAARSRILKFNSFAKIELLQPTEDLPQGWSIFRVENNGMLVHPLTGRVTKVLVPRALPANTRKVSVKFSHRNARGGKVRMGFDVRSGGQSMVESGWVEVLPGSEANAAVVIDVPSAVEHDLVLLSTIDGVQDFAWAFADHVSIEVDTRRR